jgi:hypothetical protein
MWLERGIPNAVDLISRNSTHMIEVVSMFSPQPGQLWLMPGMLVEERKTHWNGARCICAPRLE